MPGEEHGDRAQFLDGDELLVGMLLRNEGEFLLLGGRAVLGGTVVDLLLYQWGQYPAGANGVDGDAVFRRFQRGDFRQPDDTVLGGDIGRFSLARHQTVCGGNVDDPSPFAALHAGQSGMGQMERGGKIDGDDRIPFLGGKILDIGDILNASVIDDDIDRTKGFFRLGDKRIDLLRLGHIGTVIDRLHAEVLFNGEAVFLDLRRITETVQHDIRAGFGEGMGDALSDTTCRTGDDDSLPCEFLLGHDASLSLIYQVFSGGYYAPSPHPASMRHNACPRCKIILQWLNDPARGKCPYHHLADARFSPDLRLISFPTPYLSKERLLLSYQELALHMATTIPVSLETLIQYATLHRQVRQAVSEEKAIESLSADQQRAATSLNEFIGGIADLSRAELSGIDLSLVNLTDAKLKEARLIGTNLEGAHMQGTILEGANLDKANLRAINLRGADLQWSTLRGATLDHADLRQANLAHITAPNSSWVKVDARHANLTDAQLAESTLEGADLRDSNLRYVRFNHANLRWANIEHSQIEGIHLDGADLSGTLLDAGVVPVAATAVDPKRSVA